jgi:DNA polymerase-3 subunit alpha
MIAYQTAYLKAHFPVEFMAAVLTSEKHDIERIALLIEECKKMKIEVLPPDINESFVFFSVVPQKNQIRFGLSAIKNVGDNVVEIIVEERKRGGAYLSIQNFISRVNSKVLNKKSLESLIKVGVFDKMAERGQLLSNLERLLDYSRNLQKTKNNGQSGLFDNFKFNNNEIHLLPAKPASEKEKLVWEKELLGLFISDHPLNNFKKILEQKTTPIAQISDSYGKRIKVGGIITKIKKIITKNGRPMLFVNLEDLTDKIEVLVFPGIIETNPTAFQENKIVFIKGKISNRDEAPKIICEEIEEILEA